MPEGDTIHRTAARLRDALGGRVLTRVEFARLAPPLPTVGATVERVEARGKHLLIHLSDGFIVHTHQRMTGTWHLYRPGSPWRRSARSARCVLGVSDVTAVCFAAPVVEVLDAGALARHPALRRLGPDLADPAADLDDAVRRARRLVETRAGMGEALSVGELLLDQSVACGVGNVYRCEVLFLQRLDPATPAREVSGSVVRALLATAGELLRANLSGNARTTVAGRPQGTLWVYGRAGSACRRCGHAIIRERLGEPSRVVDRCPTCQPAGGGRPIADTGTTA